MGQKGETQREMRKHLERNENKNEKTQHTQTWNAPKVVEFRGKFIAINACLKKKDLKSII